MFDTGILNECTNGCVHNLFIGKYFHHRGMRKCIKYLGMLLYPAPLKKKSEHLQTEHGANICLINYHTSPGKARRMNTSQGRRGSIL